MTYFIVNHPVTTALNSKIHKEVWYEKPLNYSVFRVFGCNTYLGRRPKLDTISKMCIFLGDADGTKGFKSLIAQMLCLKKIHCRQRKYSQIELINV
jgi:hypothetical protein